MLLALFTVIVFVFFVICVWSAYEIYLDKRKNTNSSFQQLPQTTDDNQ